VERKLVASRVPVSAFLETGRQALELELVAGEAGLGRFIHEAALNRPGLALSGFFDYFAHKRIQVLGMAEHAYLSSMSGEERAKRLREFFARRIPCVVLTRHRRVFPELPALAEEFHVPVLRSRQITMHFINAATIIMENMVAPRMTVQGTMVEIMGIGVLIDGKAGLGKSETALGLIKKGHSLVSDDVTAMRLDSAGAVIGAPVSVTRYHMEIRGLGIIHVPSLYGVTSVREEKRLDLVATLYESGTIEEPDRSGEVRPTRELLGVTFPQVMIGVKPGRDLALLVETAALDYKLRRLGHDAVKELDERLMALMSGGRAGSE
jgi:HPr kinase/phosphorylase